MYGIYQESGAGFVENLNFGLLVLEIGGRYEWAKGQRTFARYSYPKGCECAYFMMRTQYTKNTMFYGWKTVLELLEQVEIYAFWMPIGGSYESGPKGSEHLQGTDIPRDANVPIS
jgi:hypothetical protein